MSIRRSFFVALPLALLCSLASLAACSIKAGTGGSCGAPSNLIPNDTCSACLESKCSSQAESALGSDFGSGDFSGSDCSDYLSCVTSCGCGESSCAASCSPSGACVSALQGLSSCQEANCASACESSGSSSTGTSTTGSGGDGMTSVACYIAAAFVCTVTQAPAATAAEEKMICNSEGGVGSDTCPSSSLLGCCTASTSKTCYYSGGSIDGSTAQMACSEESGSWSTSP